jgi:hypothetical protein
MSQADDFCGQGSTKEDFSVEDRERQGLCEITGTKEYLRKERWSEASGGGQAPGRRQRGRAVRGDCYLPSHPWTPTDTPPQPLLLGLSPVLSTQIKS